MPAPALDGLAAATAEAAALVARATAARGATFVNAEGGDVSHGSGRLLIRHTANYLAAAELAAAAAVPGPVVDIGAGTGAHSAWLGQRLGQPVTVVDHAPALRALAAAAFPDLRVAADLDAVATGSAALVTAMEVIEHIAPPDQPAFVAAAFDRVRPGGLLVLSTPDESGYLGGWSGYAPHVGCVDAAGLTGLMEAATGVVPAVWRLDGPAFQLSAVARVVEPLANRMWTAVGPLLGPLWSSVRRLAVGQRRGAHPHISRNAVQPTLAGAATTVRLVAPEVGTGTGLLAAVRRA